MSRSVLIASEVVVVTPAAALVASLPAAWRIAGEHVAPLEGWLATAGLLCPLVALLVAAARGARRAMGAMAPAGGLSPLVGTALWALASLPATAVVGAVLKANTHHRALAGATFAVLALFVHLGAALVAWRVTSLLLPRVRVRPPSARTVLALVLGAGALVLFAVTLTSAALAEAPSPAPSSAASLPALLVDGAFVLFATLVAAAIDIPLDRRKDVAWLGAGALVFVAAVGLVFVGRSAALARAVVTRAPLAGAVVEAVGLSPDR
jgi:hypothetical protein